MTFNKDWRISMRNSVAALLLLLDDGWFMRRIFSFGSNMRSKDPSNLVEPCGTIDKREFPCSDKWWLFPLTRDRVFRSGYGF